MCSSDLADIVVVDLKREHVIKSEQLQSIGRCTPFEDSVVHGLPIHTLVRGRFVMKDRELVEASRGHGRPVGRVQQMPAPTPKNLEHTTAAILQGGPAS